VGPKLCEVVLRDVRLPPGGTGWEFETDRPTVKPPDGDGQALAFNLRNLKIEPKAATPAGK
jgi:hypothetical protein